MLKPLTEWICDACGETIEAPENGYVEWQMAGNRRFGFRIVHHATRSPRRNNGGNCYYTTSERGGDMSLDRVVGPSGLAVLTSWLDIGSFNEIVFSGQRARSPRMGHPFSASALALLRGGPSLYGRTVWRTRRRRE
jgi:hypothetical protein